MPHLGMELARNYHTKDTVFVMFQLSFWMPYYIMIDTSIRKLVCGPDFRVTHMIK